MSTITNYKRFEGETDDELIYRVANDKEILGTWQAVADVLNELLGKSYTESKYRKQKQDFDRMYAANQSKFSDTAAQSKELELQRRELERLKIQFRDERNAWQKQNYTAARVEQKMDCLEEALSRQGRVIFPAHKDATVTSDNDVLVILSDLHIGQCFDSMWGKYDSDIAKDRLGRLLDSISNIQKMHHSENCYVSLQGDLISGSIHKSIQVTNRENVIDQIKLASELISSFCYELTKIFGTVYFSSVAGNHSRIEKKDEALHDERLDDLIAWNVGMILSHIDNFQLLTNNWDNGIAVMSIRDKMYVAVHGDMDSFSKSGALNLCTHLGFIPYAITFGHMHTCAVDEANGIKMIRGGSLAGSGDSYTIEKRLSGSPSQMVCVCNADGVVCYYPIDLK